jgi:hypothetical protein
MSDLVRARAANGREITVGRAWAEQADDLQILDDAATDRYGRVLGETRANGRPPKRKTSVAKKAAAKRKTSAATTAAEKKAAASPAKPAQTAEEATA